MTIIPGADPAGKLAGGLKAHSHEERRRITDALVPLIVRHMGSELLALAETGSFARNNDRAYSDLELIGFVKRQQSEDRAVVNVIYDGLLIHLWFLTREEYINIHKSKVKPEWAYAAASTLVPLLNEPFIRTLVDVPLNSEPADYRTALLQFWPQVQEATGKLMNAAIHGNGESAPFLYWNMVVKLSVALSLLNARPFSTLSAVFAEARAFAYLPKSYQGLLDPLGDRHDLGELGRRAIAAFEETERLLHARGLRPYAESLDCFVRPLSFGASLRHRLWANRLFHKWMHAADRVWQKLRYDSSNIKNA